MNELDQRAVTAQLFRYAQDLDHLIQQHDRLQHHHQMVLQSLGQDVVGEDLLTKVLEESAAQHWVTDLDGNVLRAVSRRTISWGSEAYGLQGQDLLQLLEPSEKTTVCELLERLDESNCRVVQVRLQVGAQPKSPQGNSFDILLLPSRRAGQCQIDWFFQYCTPPAYDVLQAPRRCVQLASPEQCLMVVDPNGDILAASKGYCSVTGYSEIELIGKNPRLLSSGRHDAQFYRDFWSDLQRTGGWSGTIFNRRKDGRIFLVWQVIRGVVDSTGKLLCYLSAMVDLTYVGPSIQRLQAIAYTDPLTGLANRRMLSDQFVQTLAKVRQTDQQMAILFIDLDQFKQINDDLGHAVGDFVLNETARRMRSVMAPGDLLARLGGDEFVVLICSNTRVHMAEAIGAQIQEALKPALQIQNCELFVSCSIGCARYPQDGEDMETLLKRADAAMYGAKRFGITFCYYDAGVSDVVLPDLEVDLWRALERNEISLVYQPQVCNDQLRSIRGVEVLMRWTHSVLGEVEPINFISLAERSGAIVPLGYWVLASACAQVRKWRDQGWAKFTLSLNISLRQLRHDGFLAAVQEALIANKLDGGDLEMELSEAQAMLFVQGDVGHVQALRKLGVRIAIDDYGVTLSSLSRLNFLNISSFKLNPQCVRDLTTSADARAISNCMISISKAMGIEVIAQGVETLEQALVLEQQGCSVMQGYYTGAPVSADAMGKFLADA